MLTDHFPLLGLRVRTARLELRLPDPAELAELADLAAAGVHRPDERPFLNPLPEDPAARARDVVQRHWRQLGAWKPADWSLDLAVFEDGRPLGFQQLEAQDFAVRREIRSGSWLSLPQHGRGVGTEMRAAVLHLAFAGLGAAHAVSCSFADNPAPLAVSRRLGYRPDGIDRDALDGRAVVSQRLRLTREQWTADPHPSTARAEIDGLAPCLPLFGLG